MSNLKIQGGKTPAAFRRPCLRSWLLDNDRNNTSPRASDSDENFAKSSRRDTATKLWNLL